MCPLYVLQSSNVQFTGLPYKQALLNEMFQAGVLCMYVALKLDSLSMTKQLINLFVIKLFEEHVPFLLQMGRHKAFLLPSASSCPSTHCKFLVSKTKPNIQV